MNKQHIPAENYISILEGISEGGQIYVTDERGRLISFDRKHVTKQGAIFVGDRVLKNSPLREIFTPRLQ